MAEQLQLRGGTTAEHSVFTGAVREVTVDTDKDTLIVHDGATAGGHELAKVANTYSKTELNSGQLDTRYYTEAELLSAIGNINSPMTHLPLKSSLDFIGKGKLNYTRSTTATYIDEYGTLQTAGINEPRFENGKLLIEGASTNNLTYSEDLLNAQWTQSDVNVTQDGTLSSDGVKQAFKITSTAALGSLRNNNIAITAGEKHSWSVDVKYADSDEITIVCVYVGGTANTFNVFYEFSTDTLSSSTTGTAGVVQREILGDGWIRLYSTVLEEGSNTTARMYIRPSSTTGSVYANFAQLEPSPFATSYIPTVASPITRSADKPLLDFLGNHPKLENSEFTIHAEFDVLGVLGDANRCIVNGGQTYTPKNNILRVDQDGLMVYYRSNGSVSSTITVEPNTTYSETITVSGDTINIYANGVLKNTVSQSLVDPTEDYYNPLKRIGVGCRDDGFTDYLNGHLGNVRIYDKVLTATEVALLARG